MKNFKNKIALFGLMFGMQFASFAQEATPAAETSFFQMSFTDYALLIIALILLIPIFLLK